LWENLTIEDQEELLFALKESDNPEKSNQPGRNEKETSKMALEGVPTIETPSFVY
jgi:TRAP-type C4-dicarboxylate transport system substrate-binding protein